MENIEEIHISPTKLPDEICEQIIKEYLHVKTTHPSYLIESTNGDVNFKPLQREDKALFLDDYDLRNEFSGNLATKVNEYLEIVFGEYLAKFEVLQESNLRSVRQKVQETPIGGGYHLWHCEQSGVDLATRVLSWTIYLNDVDEGGETEFLYQHKRIKAEKGKILMFPASFTHTHRGNPPISNEKYIVTGWGNLF